MNKERILYEQLINEKNNGKIFTKADLTSDILYELTINENICDSLIADIFNITKNQVRYERRKNNLENIFLKKMICKPELFRNYIDGKKLDFDSSLITQEIIYNSLKLFAASKGWNTELIDKYIAEEFLKQEQIPTTETKYNIEITNSYITNKEPTKKRIAGRNTNQLKNALAKIKAGQLGEEIIYNYEIKKLRELNLPHLATKVQLTTKTSKTNITYDGAGYDIVSYNKYGEKIYIEVKCSTTKNSDITFFISNKELAFMNGELIGIDKEHAFIYYVYDINKKQKTAKIEIFDYKKFNQLDLIPQTYKVSASIIN